MTTQQTDEMREAFERYAGFADLSKYKDGSYAGNWAACAYEGWQAAIESERARLIPVIEKLVEALSNDAFSQYGDAAVSQALSLRREALALAAPLLGRK